MTWNRIIRLVVCLLCVITHRMIRAAEFQKMAIIRDDRIAESSGLAASRTHPGFLWTHNDSGDEPRLFLIGADGVTQAVVTLINASAHDWEDLCSFEVDGKSWLLIGDIGDNNRKRTRKKQPCALHLVREPEIPRSNGQPNLQWLTTSTTLFEFEDGAHDCEALAVDVERREILLLTKSSPQKCGLFSLPLRLGRSEEVAVARRIASPFLPFATAMDVSPDGRRLVVGSMIDGVKVTRQADQSWAEAFAGGGERLALPKRRQGESICFDARGRSLFVSSEGKQQPLWKVTP